MRFHRSRSHRAGSCAHWLWRVVLLFCLALAGCATAPENPDGATPNSLAEQLARVTADAPSDAPRYIFIGAALNDREDVFDADIRLMDGIFRQQWGDRYRSVLLSNRKVLAGTRDLPLASIKQVRQVFRALGRSKRPNDRFIVLLSSHGGPGALQVEEPVRAAVPTNLHTARIAEWMGELWANETWLIISACYSGSHLDQLGYDSLITMTASSAARTSFGCSSRDANTWFIKELAASLGPAKSFREVWAETRQRIATREAAMQFPSSDPQIQFGSAMKSLEDKPVFGF